MVFSGYMPSSGIAGSYGNFLFLMCFLRNYHTVLCTGWINLLSQQQNKRVPFSPTLSCLVCRFFVVVDGHSGQCEVIPHCSFDFHFSNSDVEYLLLCLLAICMFPLERSLFRSYTHFFFDWIVCFLDIEPLELFVNFGA